MQPICSGPQCFRPVRAKGLCASHYQQRIAGRPITVLRPREIQSDEPCAVEGCDQPRKAKGLCKRHYKRQLQGLDLVPKPRVKATCSVPRCDRPARSKGMCGAHYERVRTGKPIQPRFKHAPRGSTLAEVMELHTDKSPEHGGCWLWTGSIESGGRGLVMEPGVNHPRRAHRVAYELANGAIPEGHEIDHQCRVLRCVNPDHLKAVTRGENMQNLSGARADSSTGMRGVTFKRGKWYAEATVDKIRYSGGPFATAEEANTAAIALRNRFMTNNLLDRE